MALANLVVLFAQFFARMGLASALVQKPELSKEDIRAASTAGVALGAACFVAVWVLSPAISDLFRQPALSPVLRALGVSFIFQGWATTAMGLLRRQLRFRELSLINVGTYVLGYLVVGIGSALLGAGVWSLVAAALVNQGSLAVWQYALVPHPVRPVVRWEPYRAVCGYGMRLSGAHLMDYVGSNLDTFTVGRVASTAVVGQYSRAYYLVFQPFRNYLTQALTTVLFSHLSRIQDDSARLRRAYLSVLSLGGILLFPACAGIAVAARELVLVVLGPQWDLAATIVPWFALAGACSVISALSQVLAEARADLNRSLGIQGAYILALAALLALALKFRSHGVWVFGAAVAVAEVARHLGYLELMRRILRLSTDQIWRVLWAGGVRERRCRARRRGDPQGPRRRTCRPCWSSRPRSAPPPSRWRCAFGSARCRPSAASCGCGCRRPACSAVSAGSAGGWRRSCWARRSRRAARSRGHDRPARARRRAVGRRRPRRRAHRGAPPASGHRGRPGARRHGAERRPAGPGAGAGVAGRHAAAGVRRRLRPPAGRGHPPAAPRATLHRLPTLPCPAGAPAAAVPGAGSDGVRHRAQRGRVAPVPAVRQRRPLLRHVPTVQRLARPDREALAGHERPHDGARLPALAGRLWGDRRGGAGGAVRGRRGRPGHRRSLHVLPRQRRRADGAVLAASRPAGTKADACWVRCCCCSWCC